MTRFDILLYLGTTYSATIFLGEDVDLSEGYTASLKIKEHPLSTDTLLTLTTSDALELTEFGELKIEIPHDQAGLPTKTGIYDCILTNTATGEKTLTTFGYYYPNRLASTP